MTADHYGREQMKVVVGLGNPGSQYRGTPHNLGFRVADLLAARSKAQMRLSSRERAELAETSIRGDRVLLIKPVTFMNLSKTLSQARSEACGSALSQSIASQ